MHLFCVRIAVKTATTVAAVSGTVRPIAQRWIYDLPQKVNQDFQAETKTAPLVCGPLVVSLRLRRAHFLAREHTQKYDGH